MTSPAGPPSSMPRVVKAKFRSPGWVFAISIGAILVFVSGANPVEAYVQIFVGALAPDNLPNTLNWAVPLVGMTLVAAIPLRGGMNSIRRMPV